MSDSNLVVFSQYAELQKEIDALRENLAALFFEHDELVFHICRNIQTDYFMHFGALEYKAYELQCKILRINRKIHLIQLRINRDEPVPLQAIEQQLDIEYADYIKTLEEKMDQMNDALHRSNAAEWLCERDTAELKKLYHKIVRRLHPDVNKNTTPQEKQLFLNAVLAYENADLYAMRTIALLLEESADRVETIGSLKEMQNKKEYLTRQCHDIQTRIERVKNSFPYTEKELLQDKERVAARIDELNTLIAEYKETYVRYEQRLKAIMENVNG